MVQPLDVLQLGARIINALAHPQVVHSGVDMLAATLGAQLPSDPQTGLLDTANGLFAFKRNARENVQAAHPRFDNAIN